MKKINSRRKYIIMFAIAVVIVLSLSIVFLILGDYLASILDVIGIRVATLFVAFASFCVSSIFSLLLYAHNKAIHKANQDANKRNEQFRDLQFVSGNYSIIEYMDRMLISVESELYVNKFIKSKNLQYHLILSGLNIDDVFDNPSNYEYVTVRIPFRIIEGKMVSKIALNRIHFERNGVKYQFKNPKRNETSTVILYNEKTKRSNMIINLIVSRGSDFFKPLEISEFSKIKMQIRVTSVLGIRIKGIAELFFTNPEQIEGVDTNTYHISSSSFMMTDPPQITDYSFDNTDDYLDTLGDNYGNSDKQ